MARHSIHNRRAGRGNAGGGASWISYSDMMAALLLLFVLILCVSLYQYFNMLEEKSRELEAQRLILVTQQTDLDTKSAELEIKNAELEKNQQAIIIIQGELAAEKAAAEERQAELDAANSTLIIKQTELAALQEVLTNKEAALVLATSRLEEQQNTLDEQQKLLDEQKLALMTQTQRIDDLVGVRTTIIRNLSQALTDSNMKATVDPNSGDIVLESTVFFESGRSVIKEEGRNLLDAFIPVYLNVLLDPKYENYLGEIIIEGHTDSSGSYETNLKLSQDRALQVALYCLNMDGLTSAQKTKLRSILTAKGRSYSDLIYDADGKEDSDASRRVEFKFSLKDSDMINEMNRILQGTETE